MFNAMLSGRLGRDSELKQVGSSSVCSFSIACSTGFGENKQTHWVDCSLWGNQGVALKQYLRKGQQVSLIGEFSEKESGGKVYKKCRVYSIDLVGSSNQEQSQGFNQAPTQGFNQAPAQGFNQAPAQGFGQQPNQGYNQQPTQSFGQVAQGFNQAPEQDNDIPF